MTTYQNKTFLQGRVASQPRKKLIRNTTPAVVFELCCIESWLNSKSQRREHRNLIRVEAMGLHCPTAEKAQLGDWVSIWGYIRTDQRKGQHVTCVRVLEIHVDTDEASV